MITVPNKVILLNGVEIPLIGSGPASLGYTPKSHIAVNRISHICNHAYNRLLGNWYKEQEYIDAVAHSFRIGFTLLDYSASYGDGRLIGKAIKKSGIDRKKLFLTTRVSNWQQKEGKIKESLIQQLEGFGTDYVDLFMFHWPMTDYYLDTWKEMVDLYKAGYCRAVGVANCQPHHIERLVQSSDVMPMVNQIEIHPLFTQKELINYCWSKQIVVEAYTAIARFDDRLMRLPLLHKIAEKYDKTVIQVILRWHIQTGVIPLVRSLNKKRQLENISIFDFKLTEKEMYQIDSLNINSRLRYDPDNCDFSIL